MRVTGPVSAAVLGTAAGSVAAVAILVAAHQPSPPANLKTSKARLQWQETEPSVKRITRLETNDTPSHALGHEPAVRITGCLERDADAFRLERTTGVDVPRSRSWKSGFLRKRPVPIEVVDAANTLHLSNQVGQRVSVMGVLVDREMQARSVQRVGGTCDK
jgi:hypothetical protein